MFFNSSLHTMDAKKRLFVPKRFQQLLTRNEEGNLECVLTQGQDGCLYLFSVEGFERAIADLDTRPFTGPAQRQAQRALFANADRIALDAAGRMLISEPLRRLAGLEKEVVLAGAGKRAEVWSKERWERIQEQGFDFDGIDEVLRDRGDSGGDRS